MSLSHYTPLPKHSKGAPDQTTATRPNIPVMWLAVCLCLSVVAAQELLPCTPEEESSVHSCLARFFGKSPLTGAVNVLSSLLLHNLFAPPFDNRPATSVACSTNDTFFRGLSGCLAGCRSESQELRFLLLTFAPLCSPQLLATTAEIRNSGCLGTHLSVQEPLPGFRVVSPPLFRLSPCVTTRNDEKLVFESSAAQLQWEIWRQRCRPPKACPTDSPCLQASYSAAWETCEGAAETSLTAVVEEGLSDACGVLSPIGAFLGCIHDLSLADCPGSFASIADVMLRHASRQGCLEDESSQV